MIPKIRRVLSFNPFEQESQDDPRKKLDIVAI